MKTFTDQTSFVKPEEGRARDNPAGKNRFRKVVLLYVILPLAYDLLCESKHLL